MSSVHSVPVPALDLLPYLERIVKAPLLQIADELSTALEGTIAHSALVIFTEDCTGRPQKKSGDPRIIERVTIAQLDTIMGLGAGRTAWSGRAPIGGDELPYWAFIASTGALLVLTDPVPTTSHDNHLTRAIWNLTAERIRQQVSEAPPSYLLESRAASTERTRVTAELTEAQASSLESILAPLRARELSDSAARNAARDIAVAALVQLRSSSERVISMTEEDVGDAFERLRSELRPLTSYRDVDFQFAPPPVDGRALPGEVAHAARAIVRGTVLTMLDQEDVTRVRIHWDCDGENLLIDVRDDGPGQLRLDGTTARPQQQRVNALGGDLSIQGTLGWGSDVTVRLPLDPPAAPSDHLDAWNLAEREQDVLRHLTEGLRNRQIAQTIGISENTVKFHLASLFKKLGVTSRAAAVALAFEAGFR